MSKISLAGNASGTGTFTIASPNGNTDRTINLPDSNGTILTTATPGVPVNGPAFSAYPNASQTLSNTTWTKLLFQTEEFDTNSCFASSTFTPTVAGYYQINGRIQVGASVTTAQIAVYKNGTGFKKGNTISTNTEGTTVSALIYLNGSTDYVDLYGFFVNGQVTTFDSSSMYFQAFLVRSAT